MKRRILSLFSIGFVFLMLIPGCSNEVEFGAGSQLSGQLCFSDDDCSSSLICKERRCTPTTVLRDAEVRPQPDTGPEGDTTRDGGSIVEDATQPLDAGPPPPPSDVGPTPDATGPGCPTPANVCLDDQRLERCTLNPAGQVRRQVTTCDDDEICRDGACRSLSGCCANGCADGEFCYQCACTEYETDVCRFQDQPCLREGATSNGYLCTNLGGQSTPRCLGLCDRTSARPDENCPDTHGVCALGDDNGICFGACNSDDDCGEPGMGCLRYQTDKGVGVCVFTNDDNARGASCDSLSFFDCSSGNACLDFSGSSSGGSCQQICRPFAHEGGNTDCDEGFCLVFTPRWGVCAPSNDFFDGQRCEPELSTCSEDAVGCYASGPRGPMCLRICRRGQAATDCLQGQTCMPFDADNPELGICTDFAP